MFATLAMLLPPAAAQRYPERIVRLIVPFPSGASQILGILAAEKLSEALGQPVVADFRPGAGGTVGAEVAARSPNDGHTLLLTSVSLAIGPSIYKSLKFDPLRDFTPVSGTKSESGRASSARPTSVSSKKPGEAARAASNFPATSRRSGRLIQKLDA